MKFLWLLVATVLVASSSADKPAFCHDYDCPEFTVLKTVQNDIELREYEPSYWATTNITGNAKMMDAMTEGSNRLQKYFDKDNDANAKMDETNPVFVMLYPTENAPDRAVEANFTIEFFLPHKFHDNPPKPNNADANVIDVPKQQVYVQSFGGYATQEDIVNRGFDLMDKVKEGGEDVERGFFGFASYDSWIRVANRHNEVWVWTKQKPST